jgi:Tfp pilus assembly protein FimT
VIVLLGILLTFAVQRTQIETSNNQASAQLRFAKIQAESQQRLQESELTAKLSDSIASVDPKKREVGIIALQRSVPADTYEAVLQVLIRSDSDEKVREEAIKRLSHSTNSDVLGVLNDVEGDEKRSQRERQLAKTSARNVSLFSNLPKAAYIIGAAAAGYIVSDSSKYGGGLFTNYFAEGLGGKADENGNNKTTAYELYKYIENQLQYDSAELGGVIGQVPLLAAASGFDPQIFPPYNRNTKLYGVIIGISKYKNQMNLRNADKDAERIHRALS